MRNQAGICRASQAPEPEEYRVVTEIASHGCLAGCPARGANNAGDHHRAVGAGFPRPGGLDGELENRAQQSASWLVNRKLSGVNAHSETPSAGVEVVPSQGALPPFIQATRRAQCERVSGNHQAPMQCRSYVHQN